MTHIIIPFPGAVRPAALIRPAARPIGGEIFILPSVTGGGSWAVVHESEDANHWAWIADGILDMNDALALAKRIAKEYQARVEGNDFDAIAVADLRHSDDRDGDE
jgi:hypothetical protein